MMDCRELDFSISVQKRKDLSVGLWLLSGIRVWLGQARLGKVRWGRAWPGKARLI
jgi:hypothetical protein